MLHGTLAQLRSAEGVFELDRVSAQHWGSSSDSAEDGSDYGLSAVTTALTDRSTDSTAVSVERRRLLTDTYCPGRSISSEDFRPPTPPRRTTVP
jgi:hypothetical protein